MSELGIRVEMRDNPGGYPVAWVIDERGVQRRASREEQLLWEELQRALARLEAHEAASRQPRRAK